MENRHQLKIGLAQDWSMELCANNSTLLTKWIGAKRAPIAPMSWSDIVHLVSK